MLNRGQALAGTLLLYVAAFIGFIGLCAAPELSSACYNLKPPPSMRFECVTGGGIWHYDPPSLWGVQTMWCPSWHVFNLAIYCQKYLHSTDKHHAHLCGGGTSGQLGGSALVCYIILL